MGKKLLVADDSATIQKVIKLALSSEGYDILAVADGREAVRAIQEERPDIVLIDVALSNGDACTVKKAVNQDPGLSFIKFILMASAFEKVNEQAVGSARFDSRLIKPFDPAHLRKMVSDLLTPPVPSASFDSREVEDFISIEPPPLPVAPETEITVFDGMGAADSPGSAEAEDEEGKRKLENDIRDLTESTIKMSGLDEFDWSLEDSKKMKSGKTVGKAAEPAKLADRKKLSIAAPAVPFDDGGSNFLKVGLEQNAQRQRAESPRAQTVEAAPSGVSLQELERALGKDVQAVIERLAKELVPKIAESLIKKEIEKILSET